MYQLWVHLIVESHLGVTFTSHPKLPHPVHLRVILKNQHLMALKDLVQRPLNFLL